MNRQFRKTKQTIRAWVRKFDDERLAAVYAFNADGHMQFGNSCSCLLGVTLAKILHTCVPVVLVTTGNGSLVPPHGCLHYQEAFHMEGGGEAGLAYRALAFGFGLPMSLRGGDLLRQRRLSPILRAEMRRRERVRATHLYQQKPNDTELLKSGPEVVSA